MNRLSVETRTKTLELLLDGLEMKEISRIMDVSRNSISKLLVDIGSQCLEFQDEAMQELRCKTLQCNAIWSFHYSGQVHDRTNAEIRFYSGDAWTWMACCRDTYLVPCWEIAPRNAHSANLFISGLASRLVFNVQLISNSQEACLRSTEGANEDDVDYPLLKKLYGATQETDPRLSLRDSYGLLVPALRRKVANVTNALGLHYMHYNFIRIHKALGVTPAMAAGISHRPWLVEDIAALG